MKVRVGYDGAHLLSQHFSIRGSENQMFMASLTHKETLSQDTKRESLP